MSIVKSPPRDQVHIPDSMFQVGDRLYALDARKKVTPTSASIIYGFVYAGHDAGGVKLRTATLQHPSLQRRSSEGSHAPTPTGIEGDKMTLKKGGSQPTTTPEGHKGPKTKVITIVHKDGRRKITERRTIYEGKCYICSCNISGFGPSNDGTCGKH